MTVICRRALLKGAVVLLALLPTPSFAQQAYPVKPIRVINPFPPGGPVDVVGRPVFERLREVLGQPVIMDHRPGAGSIIGSAAVAKAPPDGYTLLATAGQHTINLSVYQKLPYDTARDFVSVSMIATGPYVLVVHPSVPAKSLRDLVALAKTMPGKLTYASASPGSGFHMAAERLNMMAGIRTLHVPYKGGAPAGIALLGGEVDMMFSSPAVVLPHVRSGRMRALAVSSPGRFSELPNVPTMAEQGMPDFDATAWYGLFAPAGTPRDIVALLAARIDAIVRTAEVREVFRQAGLESAGGTPEFFDERVRSDIAKWAKVARAANVKVD
jgi:tripartite-type tricarboxylate transporter receptor subunit TctC